MSETEQNKTEEATPFKLKKAREKGIIAKGLDLPFFATLAACCFFAVMALGAVGQKFQQMTRELFLNGISAASGPDHTISSISMVYMPAVQTLAIFGGTVMLAVIFVQILQLRGLLFTAHPLKPDFNRLNPMKGLKRLFSMRTLKEAFKNIFKMFVYSGCAALLILYCISNFGKALYGADALVAALHDSALKLLFLFTLLSLFFAVLDQIIVRQEFKKQMRMSRSELNREHKDREGEPRLKQKRKQLHAEFAKQSKGLGNLKGSDVVITNPEHYAVALQYDPSTATAPLVTAKGRNHFAQILKQRAFNLSIPIVQSPALARSIYRSAEVGAEIQPGDYHPVAQIYIKLKTTP